MVGRPREFDTDKVLDAAMRAFWANGYEATSLADLMEVTGLHKGSLYQAFGDKHSLFLQSLKRYLDEMRRQKTVLLKAAPTPLEGISAVAHGMIEMANDDQECPGGCMAINTLVELAPHDPKVREIMGAHIIAMRSSLEETVTAAQEQGQIAGTRPPELITAMIITFVSGLGTQLKGGMDKAQAHDLIDAQMQALM